MVGQRFSAQFSYSLLISELLSHISDLSLVSLRVVRTNNHGTQKYVISIKNLLSYNYYFDDHKNVVRELPYLHNSASIDTLAYNMDFPPKCAQSSAQEQTAVPENENHSSMLGYIPHKNHPSAGYSHVMLIIIVTATQ